MTINKKMINMRKVDKGNIQLNREANKMANIYGKKTWIIPDGELPPVGNYELKGHESIIILNMSEGVI